MEKIIDLLLNYVEPDDEITADTSIKEDLGMTSFDLVCFGDDLCTMTGVRLTADDFRYCETVGKLSDYIAEKSK